MSSYFQFPVVPFLCVLRLFVPSQEFLLVFLWLWCKSAETSFSCSSRFWKNSSQPLEALKNACLRWHIFPTKYLSHFSLSFQKRLSLKQTPGKIHGVRYGGKKMLQKAGSFQSISESFYSLWYFNIKMQVP